MPCEGCASDDVDTVAGVLNVQHRRCFRGRRDVHGSLGVVLDSAIAAALSSSAAAVAAADVGAAAAVAAC